MVAFRSITLALFALFAAVMAQSPAARKRAIDVRRRAHMARRIKRDMQAQLSFEEQYANACPAPETACPDKTGFECIDLQQTLDSCGACGWSCEAAHPNAKTISCADGACIIHACKSGFSFDTEAATCV